MRTRREFHPEKRIIYHTELSACPVCDEALMTYDYLTWDKTVQTLSSVLYVASRPSHCADPACAGHGMRLLSAEGQQIAPKGFGYGYDVVTRIGWLRQDRRDIYADIHSSLSSHVQISLSLTCATFTRMSTCRCSPARSGNTRTNWCKPLDSMAD